MEILHRIVESASDDMPTLSALALTSTSLVSAAQALMFKELRVGGEEMDCDPFDRFQVLCQLLGVSPHLLSYVRHLTICFVDHASVVFNTPITSTHPSLPRVLQDIVELMSLVSLRIIGSPIIRPDGGDFRQRPVELQEAISRLFSMRSISKIQLERVRGLPLFSVLSAPSLKHLSLIAVDFGPLVDAPAENAGSHSDSSHISPINGSAPRPFLSSLDIVHNYSAGGALPPDLSLQHLLTAQMCGKVDLTRLRELSLTTVRSSGPSPPGTKDILRMASERLQSLVLRGYSREFSS